MEKVAKDQPTMATVIIMRGPIRSSIAPAKGRKNAYDHAKAENNSPIVAGCKPNSCCITGAATAKLPRSK